MERQIEVLCCTSNGKGKFRVAFDTGLSCIFYLSEIRSCSLSEGCCISAKQYDGVLTEVIGRRARKRAMHLLQKMDRTEKQLREKLTENGYPDSCIEDAIRYVKKYHYVDDLRYACSYVRIHQERKSRTRIIRELQTRGIEPEYIEQALQEEYQMREEEQIQKLLAKRNYDPQTSDMREKYRIYQYLRRKGYHTPDINRAMEFRFDEIFS